MVLPGVRQMMVEHNLFHSWNNPFSFSWWWLGKPSNFTSYTGGPGINIAGNIISNTGDTTASDDITIGYPASGDLTGCPCSPTVHENQKRTCS
ncbi:MAG: hypothetical protein R3B93_22285 [Bacteroidia bacterium]